MLANDGGCLLANKCFTFWGVLWASVCFWEGKCTQKFQRSTQTIWTGMTVCIFQVHTGFLDNMQLSILYTLSIVNTSTAMIFKNQPFYWYNIHHPKTDWIIFSFQFFKSVFFLFNSLHSLFNKGIKTESLFILPI